jgi:predicted small integral membrane protein
MCPACWELRAVKVPDQKSSTTGLQTASLVLGCISLLPIPLLQLASIIIGIVALVKAREGPARAARRRPIIGLCLTGVGLMWWVLAIVAVALK